MPKSKAKIKGQRQGDYILMSLEELRTPTDGRLCMKDRWWLVADGGFVLFFRHYTSPQCNDNVEITKRLAGTYPGVTNPVFVETAFIPHNCLDYADS